MSTPTEDAASRASLELLRCQRAHRRGAITRLSKKLSLLLDKPLSSVPIHAVKELENDIRADVAKHEALQVEIDV